ncbi:MAG: hypothetical protein EHM20_15950 [Alphaproteobacteria bacterium]|nr:MAG: hypothetical protein EHM20_15950 [Alphaproteobacteria bacterium]
MQYNHVEIYSMPYDFSDRLLVEHFKPYLTEIPKSVLKEKQYEYDNTPEMVHRFKERAYKIIENNSEKPLERLINIASYMDKPKSSCKILSNAILSFYYCDINFKN